MDCFPTLFTDVPKGAKFFRIHTAPFKTRAEANTRLQLLLSQKYLGYGEVFGNEKDGYRIQSGHYTSQVQCEFACKLLIEEGRSAFCSIIGRMQ
ncbi:SPOR domain-containing protein [Lysinibacillus sp. NPDC056959]|uniref:SPOR domain-containing protein n=1 Tax=Lysinibacillus sp. NPDC056959 TaxID=3345981 RepID=UPI00363C7206